METFSELVVNIDGATSKIVDIRNTIAFGENVKIRLLNSASLAGKTLTITFQDENEEIVFSSWPVMVALGTDCITPLFTVNTVVAHDLFEYNSDQFIRLVIKLAINEAAGHRDLGYGKFSLYRGIPTHTGTLEKVNGAGLVTREDIKSLVQSLAKMPTFGDDTSEGDMNAALNAVGESAKQVTESISN